MPARINGIGTTYLGQQNARWEYGICESCGHPGNLSSYETRLWFSILYIPVIPLAKRQILNYCPRCTRHRAMPIEQWQEAQAKAIGSAMTKVDANPDSPDHAVECHATLASCGKREEADQYAEIMRGRFGDDADVQMYLGGWFERTGRSKRADECFAQALKVAPHRPDALRAVAIGLAQQDKPRQAEEKLAAFRPPSSNYEPSLFYAVAQSYQRTGDHESALGLLKMVIEATPVAAKDKQVRKAVQRSESALGLVGSILAPIPLYKRPAVVWSAVAAAAILALIGVDRYFAQHRELSVVNGLSQPLKVRLDRGSPIDVPAQGRLPLTSTDGPHTISVIEPAVLAHDEQFNVKSDILARWQGDDVNVVDPTHSAVVVWEESIYSANANGGGGDFRLHVGEPYVRLTDIDYKFVEFPPQIQLENRSSRVKKHRASLAKVSPLQLLQSAPEALSGDRLLDYLETHLAASQDADRLLLLAYYLRAAITREHMDRSRDYLKKFLGNRPVDVDFHRGYQTVTELTGRQAELAPEYDAMIEKEPNNTDLLYLRGRIEPLGADSAKFYEAALRNDPRHSYAWSAKSFLLSAAGEFDDALAAVDKAIEIDPKRDELKEGRRQLLQALGRHDRVVQEIRDQIKAEEDLHLNSYTELIPALVYQGDLAEANRAAGKIAEVIDREWPKDPMQLKLKCRLSVLLAEKKYAELLSAAAELTDATDRSAWSFIAHLCDGRLEEAAADVQSLPASRQGISYLCVSVAERNRLAAGQTPKSLERAIDALAKGTCEERIVAQWLRQPPANAAHLLSQVTDIAIDPEDKIVVVLALAGIISEGREQFVAFAEQLRAWPSARQPFVESTLAAMR